LSGGKTTMRDLARIGEKLNWFLSPFFDVSNPNRSLFGIEKRMFAHEIGNVLTILYSLPLLLKEDSYPDLDLEYRQKVGVSLKQVRDLSRLVTANFGDPRDILANSASFMSDEVISQAINYALSVAPHPEQFEFANGSSSPIEIYSDKSIILAAVSTLLGNSVKYAALREGKYNVQADLYSEGKNIILKLRIYMTQLKNLQMFLLGKILELELFFWMNFAKHLEVLL
jgi:hypothetical protein